MSTRALEFFGVGEIVTVVAFALLNVKDAVWTYWSELETESVLVVVPSVILRVRLSPLPPHVLYLKETRPTPELRSEMTIDVDL